MPIYAYKCASCGFAKDVLQKLSEPPLSVCPSCGEPAFSKQVTAAGFQLKGSGWYATDFRGGKPAGEKKDGNGGKDDGKQSDATASAKSDDKSDSKTSGSDAKIDASNAKSDAKKSEGKSETGSNAKSDTKSATSSDVSVKPSKPAAPSGGA